MWKNENPPFIAKLVPACRRNSHEPRQILNEITHSIANNFDSRQKKIWQKPTVQPDNVDAEICQATGNVALSIIRRTSDARSEVGLNQPLPLPAALVRRGAQRPAAAAALHRRRPDLSQRRCTILPKATARSSKVGSALSSERDGAARLYVGLPLAVHS